MITNQNKDKGRSRAEAENTLHDTKRIQEKVEEIVSQPNGALPIKEQKMSPLMVNAIIASIAGFFSVISISPFMFIYLKNESPPAVYTVRKVLTPEVRPGELLRIRIAADVPQKCDTIVYRTIVDASTRRHGFDPAPRPAEPEYDVVLTTPLEAVPGPAYYSGRLEWACNWVQQWFPQSVVQKNIPFMILPNDKTLPEIQQQLAPTVPEPGLITPLTPGFTPYQEGKIPTETFDPGPTASTTASKYDDN